MTDFEVQSMAPRSDVVLRAAEDPDRTVLSFGMTGDAVNLLDNLGAPPSAAHGPGHRRMVRAPQGRAQALRAAGCAGGHHRA
ncbi:hypothetical protein QJS66_04930 [Kocuria rhizophila]|nr:hypothetical protein QJS66_04930 [Kocuria rhizophila]